MSDFQVIGREEETLSDGTVHVYIGIHGWWRMDGNLRKAIPRYYSEGPSNIYVRPGWGFDRRLERARRKVDKGIKRKVKAASNGDHR